jgi:hypothetical protein
VHLTTFFPGVTDVSQAGLIELAAGDERTGIDVRIQVGATGTISGVVIEGGPADGRPGLSIFPAQRMLSTDASRVFVGPDGSFSIGNLAPGRYRIAQKRPATDDVPSTWVSSEVNVNGDDVSGVMLAFSPGLSVSGRVVPLDQAASSVDLSGIRLELRRADVAVVVSTLDVVATVTDSNGAFTLTGLMPGRYMLTTQQPAQAAGRSVASAVALGRDILDGGLDVRADVTDVTVTLSSAATMVVGALQLADGRPAFDVQVVAFPTDSALWHAGSRRIRTTPAAADGTFEIRGLPPGEYFLGAAGISGPADIDRRLLDALAAVSPRVTLADGQTQRVELSGR